MSSDWTVTLIDEIKAPRSGSIAIGPFGSRMKSDCYVSDGVRVLRGTNLTDAPRMSGEFVFVSQEKAAELGNCNVFPGDLVFPHRGAIGEVGIVPDDGEKYVLSSSMMKMSCDTSKVSPLFLYYFFRSSTGRYELLKNSSQVGTPGIGQPLSSLKSIKILLPCIQTQERIAGILSLLDDRILLLRDTNSSLESIAQALFKSWFVDFDPVRAKQEGREPEGMDEATAALFPDSFESCAEGAIPRGWMLAPLEAIATVVMGLSPKGDSYNSNGIGVPLINGPVEFGDYFPVKTKWTSSATRFAQKNELILCVRGSTTGRRVVSDGEYCIGRGVCSIRPHNNLCAFLYQTFNSRLDRLLTKTTGSVFPNLSSPDIKNLAVLKPSDAVMIAYETTASPIIQRIEENHNLIRTLSSLRDTLLPRLISGQLRLPDAEALVEEAAA